VCWAALLWAVVLCPKDACQQPGKQYSGTADSSAHYLVALLVRGACKSQTVAREDVGTYRRVGPWRREMHARMHQDLLKYA
jgi:hypothetical protein